MVVLFCIRERERVKVKDLVLLEKGIDVEMDLVLLGGIEVFEIWCCCVYGDIGMGVGVKFSVMKCVWFCVFKVFGKMF